MVKPTQEDYSLLHSRARKIEANIESPKDALYWCDKTIEQLNYMKDIINKNIPPARPGTGPKVKVF